jgi:hypothetical protein
MRFNNLKKRGQVRSSASSAAVALLLIAIAIVMYVMFLQPEDRDALLNNGNVGGSDDFFLSSGGLFGDYVLNENVGYLTEAGSKEKEFDLQAFRLYSGIDSTVIKEMPSLYVERTIFENKNKTSNLKIAFNYANPTGRLGIYLNGREIFNRNLMGSDGGLLSMDPVSLPHEFLNTTNVLVFVVSSPGIAFWKINRYEISNFVLVGDVKDDSSSLASQSVYLSSSEVSKADSALLKYLPDCNFGEVGNLEIYFNGKKQFNAIADCGIMNSVIIPISLLQPEENVVSFKSLGGSYLIDQPSLKIEFAEELNPLYYFYLPDSQFDVVDDDTEDECGEDDGVCPWGCDEDEDIDCCFEDNFYWCETPTTSLDERCMQYVNENDCGLCVNGYENKRGKVPKVCEGTCGDDNDGFCPIGCPRHLDEDCCYLLDNSSSDGITYYWCDETPLNGIDFTCKKNVEKDECYLCPSNYKDKDGHEPECNDREGYNRYDLDDEINEEMKDEYDALLLLKFADRKRKEVEILINGMPLVVRTSDTVYTHRIRSYLRSDANSVEVIPDDDMHIAQLAIKVGRA